MDLEEIVANPPEATCKLNKENFRKYLKEKPNGHEDLEFILEGVPMHAEVGDGTIELCQKVANWCKSLRHAEMMLKKFCKEAAAGIVKPVDEMPTYIINLFCGPKKDDEDVWSGLRLIRNGSYAIEGTFALNDIIPPEKCSMKLPHMPEYVRQFMGMRWGAMRDLKDAFRQMLLRVSERHLCGYSIFGFWFVDTRAPYGVAPMAAHCQRFAETMIWINDYKLPQRLRDQTRVHVDDFSIAAKTKEDCLRIEEMLDHTFEELGVQVSKTKSIPATQGVRCHGVWFNLDFEDNPGEQQTVEIPKTKYDQFIEFLTIAIEHRLITIKAAESLCGKIMHYSLMKPVMKVMCWSMVHFLYQFCKNNRRDPKRVIILPMRIVRALQFVKSVGEYLRRATFNEVLGITPITISAASDACNESGAFYIAGHWNIHDYKGAHKKWHINCKEGHAVVMLLTRFGPELTGKRLLLHVDNQVIVACFAKKWSKSPKVMALIFEICALLIKFKMMLFIEWVASATNVVADALSRKDVPGCRKICDELKIPLDDDMTRCTYVEKLESKCFLDKKSDDAEIKRLVKWLKKDPSQRCKKWW